LVTASDEPENRKRARIRLELAVGYFEQGQTTVALDEVKLALTADPLFVDALNVRGLIYMRLNEPGLAEESFRRALAINPGDGGSLHNLGWLNCQRARYSDATEQFNQALASPLYADRARTFMTKGLCEMAAGRAADAEDSLTRAYALDAGNPIVGYNLADLLYKRREFNRAQFYIRRLNNSELANAQTLWLGVKIERELNNPVAMAQLGEQLRRRYPQSPELASFERGSFNE
jgi:type IV pilus assembly protein PilF